MKSILLGLAFLLLICSSQCENPGFVADVKMGVIEKAKTKYFADAFKQFGKLKVPDQSEGHLNVHDINVARVD